ncbi:tRNA nucleotidyltransferase/poly(A) polymerase [Hyella patelloides LEGE 07179]|uniref:tRNA nucleotidyltransferase/poly(A) polymerase n=1 Tax=Hyella patelloides LEGE 07179 TaxID=945734 RepID=A0A563VWD1_9CYAN|nr:CBS domain-containing protein [Hyella patelloides]VEP15726.1 tRNA nucleotidyltransferase/poly(A) polymerase [Hyella patelloides LEGE 07179]
MDLILCHQTADFDSLGAAVGLSLLKKGAKIVLTGGTHPTVGEFLALHRDEFPLIELRSVTPENIRALYIPDTQKSDRLGQAASWFDLPNVTNIEVYDHHCDLDSDINAAQAYIEEVGAITTVIAELLQQEQITPTAFEATAMALGIHVDTGSLTYDQTTSRDARALAWLMEQGANVKTIAEYVEPGLSPQLQVLLQQALSALKIIEMRGYKIAAVLLKTPEFVRGLSSLTSRLVDLTESDALLLGHEYQRKGSNKLAIIGRSSIRETNLNQLFTPHGGGGHSQAASMTISTEKPETVFQELVDSLKLQIPEPPTARDLMSSPVRTIRPDTTIEQAQRILFRYGHSGLSVVDAEGKLVGVISRRDLDLALHHGFSHAPVKGYMTRNLKTISLGTTLPEIESLMVTYDVGRLPVLEQEELIGVVTRTDVLRQLHQNREESNTTDDKTPALTSCLLPTLKSRLAQPIWQLLSCIANEAQDRGWNLYIVGGGVRDLLLTEDDKPLLLQDIDLVVDGFHRAADDRSGVTLANTIREKYPQSRLSIHGEFQTAALLWHKDPILDNLWLDIATARTEFYPYPAANPEVEASSIRQDLYRRDFTINALAVRLTPPRKQEFSRKGDLLDFFGGLIDLKARKIRVLHANSFIEDPTRIYRAVRFAVRLHFTIEPQTEEYIKYAIDSGVYERLRLSDRQAPALTTRLRAELKYILQAEYWKPALKLLADLGALRCLHQDLQLTPQLWWEIRCISRWLYYLDPENQLQHWLIRLEILICSLPTSEREIVAVNLQLPKDSIQRVRQLDQIATEIIPQLPKKQLPSEIYQLLNSYKYVGLILLGVRSSPEIRKILWQYLTKLSQVKPILNGNDLKELGYKPSPLYKQMLNDLLAATLDSKITNQQEAEAFIKDKY